MVEVEISYDNLTQVLKGEVRDTGIGIKREDISKLFKLFGKMTSTKDINRGGMGLGLTISKLILQELGGKIEVDSIEN